jgi:thiol-disulfide isomerase/thioredoxin
VSVVADASSLLAGAAVALAAVFAVAGAAKLADRRGSIGAARAFGIPERLAGVVGVGLPLAELGIAALLIPQETRWAAAGAALVLVAAFCVAIGAALARGTRPDCHCFGQLHSEPVGWRTLARNAVLAALALAIVATGRGDPGSSVLGWGARVDTTGWVVLALGVALAVVAAAGGYALVHVLGAYGRVLVRLETVEERLREAGFELEAGETMPELGLAPGTPAPAFWLPTTDGDRVSLADLLELGRPALLVFTSPTCGPCAVLMPDVARWQRDHAAELTVALVADGDVGAVRADAQEHGLEHVLLDTGRDVYEAYDANGTPSAVLVGDDGRVASWLASGPDWIGTLVGEALDGLGRTPGLPIGAEAPELRLPSLDGVERAVAEVATGPTVVLFWNPSCGFCRAMHDDLLAWQADPPPGAPTLLVVSAGDVEETRAERFTGTVLRDPDWALASAFGADGTPMAVPLDAGGRVAGPLAVGDDAVLGLLGAVHERSA